MKTTTRAQANYEKRQNDDNCHEVNRHKNRNQEYKREEKKQQRSKKNCWEDFLSVSHISQTQIPRQPIQME